MPSTGLSVFDTTIHESNRWLNAIMERLESDDRLLAYEILRGTLHAIRDRVGPDSAVHLAAQLPMLLRGLFYEGFVLHRDSSKERHVVDFVDHALSEVPRGRVVEPDEAVAATLATIRTMIDPGEARKLIAMFPDELRRLWLSVE